MRILLDESLPRRLALDLTGHEVRTVVQMGWSGLENGQLLRAAAGEFDVLLTADRNLEYQQNLSGLAIGVIVLIAQANRLGILRPLIPAVLSAIPVVRPGQVIRIGGASL